MQLTFLLQTRIPSRQTEFRSSVNQGSAVDPSPIYPPPMAFLDAPQPNSMGCSSAPWEPPKHQVISQQPLVVDDNKARSRQPLSGRTSSPLTMVTPPTVPSKSPHSPHSYESAPTSTPFSTLDNTAGSSGLSTPGHTPSSNFDRNSPSLSSSSQSFEDLASSSSMSSKRNLVLPPRPPKSAKPPLETLDFSVVTPPPELGN